MTGNPVYFLRWQSLHDRDSAPLRYGIKARLNINFGKVEGGHFLRLKELDISESLQFGVHVPNREEGRANDIRILLPFTFEHLVDRSHYGVDTTT